MAKKKNCKKQCKSLSNNKDCDNGSCPIKKSKNNKLLSLAINSWNSVIEVCSSLGKQK